MRRTTIRFIGKNGEVILEKKLTGLPLKDDFVIKKSIEFFNDPEPCMIHRSAVMKRTYMEFFEYFSKLHGVGEAGVLWEEISPLIKESIDIKEKPHAVQFHLKKK